MKIKEIFDKCGGDARAIMTSLRNADNLNDFIQETNYLPSDISKSCRYYCWLNGIKEYPTCPYCGKPKRFNDLKKGFFATCGDAECRSKAKSDANRRREVDWKEVHKKMEETYAAKHNGIRHNMQDPEFKKKFFEDYKQKHNGESCGVTSKKAVEARKKTFDEKYDGNIRAALEQGIIEKYGSLSNLQKLNAEKSRDKIVETKLQTIISRVNEMDCEFVSADGDNMTLRCNNCGDVFIINRSKFNKLYCDNGVLCENCGLDTLVDNYLNGDITARSIIAIIKASDKLKNALKDATSFLNEYTDVTVAERLYYLVNDLNDVVKCKYCDNKAKWNCRDLLSEGYITTCGRTECESNKYSDIHSGQTVISENRVANFIEWERSVTEVNDDIILENIKYDVLLESVTNPIIIDYLEHRYNDSDSLVETLQRMRMGIEEKPKCAHKDCDKLVKWIGRKRALFTKYCSNECRARSEETLELRKITSLEHWGTECPLNSSLFREQQFSKTGYYYPSQNPIIKQKMYVGKRKAMMGGMSKMEKRLYDILRDELGYEFETHYKTDLYPFACDVYIPSLDLYIEYQGWQGHGTHPYDKNSSEDNEILEKSKINEEIVLSKNKTSQYSGMIYTWTVSDPLKRETAKKNGLKYLEIFSFKDAEDVNRQIDEYLKSL